MAKNDDSQPTGQRPWRDTSVFAGGPGQKWTGPASVVVLILVIGVSAFALFAPQGDNPPATSIPAPSASTSAEDAETVCPDTPVDEDTLDTPADITWVAEYGTSWPQSATVGPTNVVDGMGQCFARSPIGAALAAVNLTQSVRVADLDQAHRILEAQYVDNEGRITATAGIDKVYPEQPPQERQWGRTMGYKILTFGADQARILLVENWPQKGQYSGFSVTLHWVAGDWRIALDASGQPSPDAPITVDPDGFTRWETAR